MARDNRFGFGYKNLPNTAPKVCRSYYVSTRLGSIGWVESVKRPGVPLYWIAWRWDVPVAGVFATRLAAAQALNDEVTG